MDVRQSKGEWMWFVSSAKWNVEVRGVLYTKGKVLVPLARDEVPFSYEDVNRDVVFLWDPATGVALATDRRKAQVVSAPVAPGMSAVALYGELPRDKGYCYRLVTGESLDLGAYPTVGSLESAGVTDVPGVVYQERMAGVYHCERGSAGLSFEQLPKKAVVGGDGTLAGCVLLGVTAAVCLSVVGSKELPGSACVASAASVDLGVPPDIVSSMGLVQPVRWFASRQLEPGVHLNMGLVTPSGDPSLPGRVVIGLPVDAGGLVCWNTVDAGVVYSRARRTTTSCVAIETGSALAGIYVYVVTCKPLTGTKPYDIHYHGYDPGQGHGPRDHTVGVSAVTAFSTEVQVIRRLEWACFDVPSSVVSELSITHGVSSRTTETYLLDSSAVLRFRTSQSLRQGDQHGGRRLGFSEFCRVVESLSQVGHLDAEVMVQGSRIVSITVEDMDDVVK
jgi:hypothetical protein